MSPTEVTERLGLMRMKDRKWYCHPSNALAGDGLFEGAYRNSRRRLTRLIWPPAGLSWLSTNLKAKSS